MDNQTTDKVTEQVLAMHESGSSVRDMVLLLELSEYRVRKIIKDYREQVARDWDEYQDTKEYHEEWRDYGEGVSVRWLGQYRLSVLGSVATGYRWYIKREPTQFFTSSSYRFKSRKEAMADAESVAATVSR